MWRKSNKRGLEDKKLIQLIKSVSKQPFHPKKSDLFQFSQTSDLLKADDKIQFLKQLLP